jgi:hypothetical protein
MDSMAELLRERGIKPFTTIQLVNRIEEQKFRQKNPPSLWHRLHKDDRMIWLGPLTKLRNESHTTVVKPSRAFLTLRLALTNDDALRQEQVKTLSKLMTQASKDSGLPVGRLDLVSYSKSTRTRTLLRMISGVSAAVRFQQSRMLTTRDETPPTTALPVTPNSDAEVVPKYIESPTEMEIEPSGAAQELSDHASKRRKTSD